MNETINQVFLERLTAPTAVKNMFLQFFMQKNNLFTNSPLHETTELVPNVSVQINVITRTIPVGIEHSRHVTTLHQVGSHRSNTCQH